MDRMDLQIRGGVPRRSSSDGAPGRLDSATAAARVARARAAASERLAGTPWRCNAEVPSRWLRGEDGGVRLPRPATAALDRAVDRAALSMRARDKLLRVAWSVADLAGAAAPTADHLAMALALSAVSS